MKTELDLHGVKHADVSRMLDPFIYEHILKGTKEVEIITGISPKMKEIVKKIIWDYGLTAEDKWGNVGCLIINMI